MFNVYLKKINIPRDTIDSRHVGYGQTVAASSTPSTIVFSTGITGQTNTWIGGMIIFTSGIYNGMAADIGGENKTSTTLDSVVLSQAFPTAPEAGTTFILFRRSTSTISYDATVYQITRFVSSVRFDTAIDMGYDSASIVVNGDISKSLNRYSEILGMDVQIEDKDGHKCFRGIVANITLGPDGGNIDCVGYMRTFSWFEFATAYGGTSDVTSPKILKDIANANPYIMNSYGIDRDGAWDTAQQAFGGIGPINFGESVISGQEAMNRILEMGRLGISIEAVYMQIYNDPIPTLTYTSNTLLAADYVINRNNYAFNQSGFNVKGSLADTYSLVDASYANSNNQTLFTPYSANIRLLERLGRRRKTVQSNSQSGLYESTAVVQQANEDYKNMMSTDQYVVSGYIYKDGLNTRVPVYYIKSGDRVRVETPYGYENIYKNVTMNAVEFYVGKTSYDSTNRVMTLYPVNDPKKSEIFAARLKI